MKSALPAITSTFMLFLPMLYSARPRLRAEEACARLRGTHPFPPDRLMADDSTATPGAAQS